MDANYLRMLAEALKTGVQASGGSSGIGGRIGVNSFPLMNNVTANLGASGFYSPQERIGQLNEYDAGLGFRIGKNKQHAIDIGAERIGTPDPYYNLQYQYEF